ncbi:MAG: protein-L-isoaspartate O-methyltransferase, partial [Bacteroidetes bacterium]|nr:protein-L-isoaspartate O-methyltransferase [Bacteroidota bacterium]
MPQRFKRARAQLVELIREKGITNERVLRAMGKVPRHMFLESGLHGRAYEDHALPLMLNQTISQPFTVAYQTSLIDAQPREKVLEIGTGSGYQAAVLAELGARVYSIERHEALLQRTNAILDGPGYRSPTRPGAGPT